MQPSVTVAAETERVGLDLLASSASRLHKMSYSSSRTTKTYSYSSGGPGGSRVTETRTVTNDGGTRTETTTHGGNGGDLSFGIGNKLAGVNISGGRRPDGHFTASVSQPVQGRYSKGWGSRRETRPPPGPPMKLEGKSFEAIRDQCLREGRLFEDPDFPAIDTSIFYSKAPPRPFVWKRPPVSKLEPGQNKINLLALVR